MLKGMITALVTPMDESGAIDFVSLENLVNQQIKAGVAGLVIAGTTGEAALLNDDETYTLINKVIAINQSRVKIIIGLSSASTKFSCDYINNTLNKIKGVDYILVLTPYYIKPTQDGLYQYFMEIAKNSIHPIILYNVPGRTSCNLHNSTVIKLAQNCSNIIGLKDATGEIDRMIELVAHKPREFLLYSGDDETSLQFMLNGGDGVISVISNIIPEKFSEMCRFALNIQQDQRNQAKATALNNEIIELSELLFIESNPIPVKWALFAMDKIKSPMLRSPLTVLLPVNQKKIMPVLEKVLGYKINAK